MHFFKDKIIKLIAHKINIGSKYGYSKLCNFFEKKTITFIAHKKQPIIESKYSI